MESKEENKSYLLEYTMYAGILLGLFWVFKYLFVILGEAPGDGRDRTTLSVEHPFCSLPIGKIQRGVDEL